MAVPFDLQSHFVFERHGEALFNALEQLVRENKVYQHQADAVRAIKQELSKPGGDYSNVSLAVLPTGTGKTGVGVLAAFACKARWVLIITPSEAISKQQYAQFALVRDPKLNPLGNMPFLQSRNIMSEDQIKKSDICTWTPVNSKCVLNKQDLDDALAKKCELVVTNVHKFGESEGRGYDITQYPRDHFSLVIVDEAHHFPAKTWKLIVDHFKEAKLGIIFLTATPLNQGKYILDSKKPCYQYIHEKAVEDGIIRDTEFISVASDSVRSSQIIAVLEKVKETLQSHDDQDREHCHKAMVLATDKDEANDIAYFWNESIKYGFCKTFIEGNKKSNVVSFMRRDNVKVLVVIYRLTEGFDYSNVSVAAILRNVAKKSRVYFAQFVGRAVRKLHKNDPVSATVISHDIHKQKENYDTFYKSKLPELAEEDPEEEEDPKGREEGAEKMETN